MIYKTLHQTVFHVEKLRNIVGISGSSAYHIMTSRGVSLGTTGSIHESDTGCTTRSAANDSSFENGFSRLVSGVRSLMNR